MVLTILWRVRERGLEESCRLALHRSSCSETMGGLSGTIDAVFAYQHAMDAAWLREMGSAVCIA
jgi:hypothetical protein